MEAKLRSIIRPIRWSLLLKAFFSAAAWLLLPWWGFLVVALYCYLVPFFRVRELALPFAALLLLALASGPDLVSAAYGAAAFTLILGIKELVIVNRRSAYGLLLFMLTFAGFALVYDRFAAWSAPAAFAALAAAALAWRWLVIADPERVAAPSEVPLALATLLLFELGVAIFLLPLSFFYQAALLFFGSVLLFEAAANSEQFTMRQLLTWGGTYAAIALLVVLLTSWKI